MADYVTLKALAAERGCTPDTLRQRIRRGTLRATKVGTTWVVSARERQRVLAERTPTT